MCWPRRSLRWFRELRDDEKMWFLLFGSDGGENGVILAENGIFQKETVSLLFVNCIFPYLCVVMRGDAMLKKPKTLNLRKHRILDKITFLCHTYTRLFIKLPARDTWSGEWLIESELLSRKCTWFWIIRSFGKAENQLINYRYLLLRLVLLNS